MQDFTHIADVYLGLDLLKIATIDIRLFMDGKDKEIAKKQFYQTIRNNIKRNVTITSPKDSILNYEIKHRVKAYYKVSHESEALRGGQYFPF